MCTSFLFSHDCGSQRNRLAVRGRPGTTPPPLGNPFFWAFSPPSFTGHRCIGWERAIDRRSLSTARDAMMPRRMPPADIDLFFAPSAESLCPGWRPSWGPRARPSALSTARWRGTTTARIRSSSIPFWSGAPVFVGQTLHCTENHGWCYSHHLNFR